MAFPSLKPVVLLDATSVATNATNTSILDTMGFDFAQISVDMATADTTTHVPTMLKLSEGDTTDSTAFSDISGFVGGTGATNFSFGTPKTAVANLYVFNVDLRARKRYIKLSVTPVTPQIVSAAVFLARAENSPSVAGTARSGCAILVEG